MNMSYCAFENTYRDLRRCLDKLEEGASDKDLGQDEARAKRNLIGLCEDIARDYGGPVNQHGQRMAKGE